MNWKDHRERSNHRMLGLARHLTTWLPRGVARALLVPAVLYFVATSAAARRSSRQFLARALPRPPSLADVFRHFMTFATVVLDRAYLVRDDLAAFDFELEGRERIEAVRVAGRGGFLIGAHLGSFEALRALGRDAGARAGAPMRIVMVMFEENARMINAALAALNPKLADDIIGLGRSDSMLRVKVALDDGAIVGVLADRLLDHDAGSQDRRLVPFLGRPAAFPAGPFRLAALIRRPVLLMLGIYEGGNRYRLVFETLHDFTDDTVDP
ncbi:MAG: acyl-CoA synthetase, partial [Lautropia sp.]